MERSLVLIKPDGVEKCVIGNIISMYEKNNLKVEDIKMVKVTKELAIKHYEDHIGKNFFDKLIKYITRGKVCAMILGGENAIKIIRDINGDTNPKKAKEGTIRALYGTNITENCVHSSDSKINAEKEINIWF